MTMEEFKAMMDGLNAAEIGRLGVGSEEFQQRHQEIMDMIQDVEDYQKERRVLDDRRKSQPGLFQ